MSLKPRLPEGRDWRWLAAFVVGGCLLGVLLNALNPHGINLRIAFGFPAAESQP